MSVSSISEDHTAFFFFFFFFRGETVQDWIA
jgi:hypothetical protein